MYISTISPTPVDISTLSGKGAPWRILCYDRPKLADAVVIDFSTAVNYVYVFHKLQGKVYLLFILRSYSFLYKSSPFALIKSLSEPM